MPAMPESREPGVITRLLERWTADRRTVGEALYPLVYDELRRIAAAHLHGERPGHTLQPTALVNETYLELDRQRRVHWNDHRHFFRLASQLMRRILLMHARGRHAAKRGGGIAAATLAHDPIDPRAPGETALLLGRLVEELAEIDPFKARLVRLRAVEELTVPECAELLGVAPATIDRHWRLARAWLRDASTVGVAARPAS
jgi:RNA polymerase sigma factor (TIGR02999 family)